MARRSNRSKSKRRVSKLRVLFLILGVLFLIGVASGGFLVAKAYATMPTWDPNDLSNQKQASLVYDKDGNIIAQLHASENRLAVKSQDIPDMVKKTFVAVEDKRFYQEPFGIDPERILSSAIIDILSRSKKEGASTITQELARNAFISDPTTKTFSRKIQEILMSFQLERRYTKDEILTFYLNKIYLGESSYGIETASKTYFGKDVNQLGPEEIALLAGLPQAPSGDDPYYHLDQAKTRRNIVLGVMRDSGIITTADYQKYINEPFTYVANMIKTYGGPQQAVTAVGNYKYPSFVDYIVNQLENQYQLTPDQIYNGGLKIHTTVDGKIQSAAENAFDDPSNFPKGYGSTPVQGAMTIVEPSTGGIVAMAGGRDYKYGNFDRAWQAQRQPVYGPAIEKGGYYPGTVFDDMPVSYDAGNGQTWSPVDDDTATNGYKGLITMRYALEDSVNIYAVKLFNKIGVDYGWSYAKDKFGLPLTEQDKNLTLALGTARVSTLDMASAYAIYANNGLKVTPHAITNVVDLEGNNVINVQIQKDQVIKKTTAYLINDMLRSVVTSGTGYAAKIGNWAVAGKTGTTSLDSAKYGNASGNPDAWFAGYTTDYAGVVWMGYDSDSNGNQYLQEVYGGSYPAQIWRKVMTVALQDKPVQSEFQKPDGIVSGEIDTKSGLLPSSLTPPQFIQNEIAVEGSFPTGVSNIWGEAADGRLKLNLPDRSPSVVWPANEAPYRPVAPIPTSGTSKTATSTNSNNSTTTGSTGSSPTTSAGQPTIGTTIPSTGSTMQTTGQTQTPTPSQNPTSTPSSHQPKATTKTLKKKVSFNISIFHIKNSFHAVRVLKLA
ncbi:Penicillin-binding protein, 1A family [Candidatus Desulfosporosinus infrequens]|uniref:Penicillin-binding protein 1A n=1 Tax=Candidatus Desulfosporosinus infrequens TaxID=2043169 RepID=A0A2U3KGT3_9FIRM|nr:Penicillin-binding protein, 1A family [Candidatus Desulfosporosinus infrequens]